MDFITQRMKLKDAFPTLDIAKFQTQYKLNEEPEFIRKGLVPEDLQFEDGERAVIEYITTAAVDRDGEVVNPKGGVLKEFKSNPVVLFGHDARSLPIGKSEWIKADDKGLVSKTVYASHPLADHVYQYRKEGFPLASSIGFIPINTTEHQEGSEERAKGIKRTYDKWLLLEYSNVPVPSNPEALALAVSKGLLTQEQSQDYVFIVDGEVQIGTPTHFEGGEKDTGKPSPFFGSTNGLTIEGFTDSEKDQVNKPGWDETDDMIRHRVREPELFVEGSFRTVPIKRDKPRVNSVMGKLKADTDPKPMKVQNIMFPKEDGWTITDAKKWVSEHPDIMKWLEDEGISKMILSEGGDDILKTEFKDEVKSGRTLSGATRKVMNTAIEAMNNAVAALTELLNTADASEEGDKGIRIQDSLTKESGLVWSDINGELNTIVSEAVERALPPEIDFRESAKEGIYGLIGKV